MKRLLTNRDAIDFQTYCSENPIDNQSNDHMPIALLCSVVQNMMGGETKPQDFMLFRARDESDEDAEVEKQLAKGNW